MILNIHILQEYIILQKYLVQKKKVLLMLIFILRIWKMAIGFVAFSFEFSPDCDVYIREYRSLLDTISTIGGLFSPFQLLFQILVIFYSEREINSEITKNVFFKIKYYEYKRMNKIPIDNNRNNIFF